MGTVNQKEAVVHRKPMAFMSYVNLDDKHLGGWMTEFCKRLASAACVRTGQEFEIFQDRNAVQWGQKWEERIDGSLDVSVFLVAMITPAFFRSEWCRKELDRFLGRELELGRSDLVLPVYCVDVPLLNDQARRRQDPLAEAVMARQHEDWRQLLFESFDSPQARQRLHRMAGRIAEVAEQLEARVAVAAPGVVAEEPVRGPDRARQEEAPLAESKQPALAAGAIRHGDQLAKERQQIAEVAKQLEARVAAAAPGGVPEPSRTPDVSLSSAPLPDLDLCLVEGGEFLMGDDAGEFDNEKPAHQVRLSSFFMGRWPVTQRLWQLVMGSNPSHFKGDCRPVESVSWDDVQEFLGRLNGRGDVRDFVGRLGCDGMRLRLPTEAEWEHAARGGRLSRGFKHAGSDLLQEVGWFDGNSGYETHEVGLLRANELGLHDMSGNVWEWCSDWYSGSYYAECRKQGLAVDPKGPAEGLHRVLRGGSYFLSPLNCRSVYRLSRLPGLRLGHVGFRLALSAKGPAGE